MRADSSGTCRPRCPIPHSCQATGACARGGSEDGQAGGDGERERGGRRELHACLQVDVTPHSSDFISARVCCVCAYACVCVCVCVCVCACACACVRASCACVRVCACACARVRVRWQWEAANKPRIDPLDPFAPTRKWLNVDEVLQIAICSEPIFGAYFQC